MRVTSAATSAMTHPMRTAFVGLLVSAAVARGASPAVPTEAAGARAGLLAVIETGDAGAHALAEAPDAGRLAPGAASDSPVLKPSGLPDAPGGAPTSASDDAVLPTSSTTADGAPSTPETIGPFRLGTAGNCLEPGLGVQLRFAAARTSDAAAAAELGLRRLRWSLRGAVLDERLTFQLQLNTTPAALELIDAWADWRFLPALRLRFGQFKTPFTRHRQTSFTALALTDWDVFSTHFGAERQLGVMLHDGDRPEAHWSYRLGVFTGVNARASFERGLANVYSEPLTNPSDLRSFHPAPSIHPELAARVGYDAAGVDARVPTDAAGGGLRYSVNVSAAWDLRPAYPVDFAARLAPEVLLKWNHLFLDVAAAAGWFKGAAGAVDLASIGENVEAGWRFFPRWEVAARFSRVDNTAAVRADARARADALIAEASTPTEQDALTKAYATAGNQRWTQEVALALNVYLFGDSLKWQSDFEWVRVTGAASTDVLRVRTQLQLAF